MTDPRVDGWYRAVGARASFGFRVEDGEVVECAPYGRKIIMGLQWGTAVPKLERGGFEIERLGDVVPLEEPIPQPNERAERFGWLLSEIELSCKAILAGREQDVMAALCAMTLKVEEAHALAAEVSHEALDRAVEP